MNIVIIRHGRCVENDKQLIMGQNHGTLSAQGIKQAECLGRRFLHEIADAIFSSDLDRALITAREIAKLRKLKVLVDVRLRESFAGKLTGTAHCSEEAWNSCADTEKDFDLYARANDFLVEKIFGQSYDRVILVAHAGINRALCAVLENKPYDELKFVPWMSNAGVTEYSFDGKNSEVVCRDCTNHLFSSF